MVASCFTGRETEAHMGYVNLPKVTELVSGWAQREPEWPQRFSSQPLCNALSETSRDSD